MEKSKLTRLEDLLFNLPSVESFKIPLIRSNYIEIDVTFKSVLTGSVFDALSVCGFTLSSLTVITPVSVKLLCIQL